MSGIFPPDTLTPWEKESMFYNTGLPSSPRLLGRSGTSIWHEPTGPEAYRFQLGLPKSGLGPVLPKNLRTGPVIGPKFRVLPGPRRDQDQDRSLVRSRSWTGLRRSNSKIFLGTWRREFHRCTMQASSVERLSGLSRTTGVTQDFAGTIH